MADPPNPGEKLDPSLGVAKGWWVSYPRVFLFAPPPDQNLLPLKLPSGEQSFGFNAVQLAAAFGPGMDAGTLILNLEIGSLSVREEPRRGTIVSPAATSAIDFVFTGPMGTEIKAPVQTGPILGSA